MWRCGAYNRSVWAAEKGLRAAQSRDAAVITVFSAGLELDVIDFSTGQGAIES